MPEVSGVIECPVTDVDVIIMLDLCLIKMSSSVQFHQCKNCTRQH